MQKAIENGPFIVDLPIKNGDFHSYVSLPEGIREKPIFEWMITGGSPILGNLHVD